MFCFVKQKTIFIFFILIILSVFACASKDLSNIEKSVDVETSIKNDDLSTRENLAAVVNDEDDYKIKNIQNKEDNKIKLLFSGDVLISKKTKNAYDNKGISVIVNNNYMQLINSHDAFIGNMECVLSDKGISEDKTYTFHVDPYYVKVLTDAKYDLFTVANNHTLDYGEDAFLDMLSILNDNGINYVGGGRNFDEAVKPFVFEAAGKKIGIIATSIVLPSTTWVASGSNVGLNGGYQLTNILKQIRKLKKEVDKVVVFAHWGEERKDTANRTQVLMAHAYVDNGADLVIGAHTHTIQNIEYYNGVPIFYSLGNFIYGSTDTDTALLSATFDFNEDAKRSLSVRLVPGESFYESCKAFTKARRLEYMNKLIERSDNCWFDQETEEILDLVQVIKDLENEK